MIGVFGGPRLVGPVVEWHAVHGHVSVGAPHGLAVQPAMLDPQKMRVGGLEYNAAVYVTQQDPQFQPDAIRAIIWRPSRSGKP